MVSLIRGHAAARTETQVCLAPGSEGKQPGHTAFVSSAAKSPFLSVCPLTAVKSQDCGTEERPTCLFLFPRSHGAANTSQRPPWHPAQGTHPLPHCSHPSYLPVSAVDYVASSFTTSSLSQNKVPTPKLGLPGTSEHGPPHPCAPQRGGRTHHHPKCHTCSIERS